MWIKLDYNNTIPLGRQIYTNIKNMILNGKLKSGEKLPSTRNLSKELNISRNTVIYAYEQLIAEGYIESFRGSKTIVCNNLCFKKSLLNSEVKSINNEDSLENIKIDFKSGCPDINYLQKETIGKIYKKVVTLESDEIFKYSTSLGLESLRKEISKYLFKNRGISVSYKNIAIVSGATQGLSIISSILYKKQRNYAVIENPTHNGLAKVIESSNLKLIRIDADAKGLVTDKLIQIKDISKKISMIYLTPSHEYPLGGILPADRRIQLINYARNNNCYIIEDDYDSEFRYTGHPVNSLYEMDEEKVIYIGSFSKTLFPSLRIGYIILPNNLINEFINKKKYTDVHTNSINQCFLTHYLREGYFEKHIYKMRKIYEKKRNYLIEQLKRQIKSPFEILGDSSGLHIVLKFKDIIFNDELLSKIYNKGVKIYRIEDFIYKKNGTYKNYILLGYGNLSLKQIKEGIEIIGKICIKNNTN